MTKDTTKLGAQCCDSGALMLKIDRKSWGAFSPDKTEQAVYLNGNSGVLNTLCFTYSAFKYS